MIWLKNLEAITHGGPPGKCPHCGGSHTDCSFSVVVPEKRLGYGDIWCEDCKHACHISRSEVLPGFRTGHTPPEGLVYS